jgi:hypothetical protein
MTLSLAIARYTKALNRVKRLSTLATEAENAEDWPVAIQYQMELSAAMIQASLRQMLVYQLAEQADLETLTNLFTHETTVRECQEQKQPQRNAGEQPKRTAQLEAATAPFAQGGHHPLHHCRAHGTPATNPVFTLQAALPYFPQG